MESECELFYEDVVFKINDKGQVQFGIVIENSAYMSSDEDDSDSEPDQPKTRQLKQGQVKVAWHPLGNEEIIAEKKIHLVDRALMPGDVVCRKEPKSRCQRGYCKSVKVLATIQVIGTQQVLCDIPAEKLQSLEEFVPDVAVALDNWVGMVRRVNSRLTLRTTDGSVCTMTDERALALRDISDRRRRGTEFHRYEFYPGQQLSGKLSMFASAVWIKGGLPTSAKGKHDSRRLRVTVEAVEVTSLNVHWECQSSLQTPSLDQQMLCIEKEDLKRVKVLNVFEPCTLQVGDRNYYTIKETDVLFTKGEWERTQKEKLLGPSPTNNNVKKAIKHEVPKEEIGLENGEVASGSDDYEGMESDTGSDSGSHTSSSCSSFSQSSRKTKGSKKQGLVTKVLKRKKLRRARAREQTTISLKPGDKILVETLATSSWTDVVWQDGTVELGIQSRHLLPIQHLDDQEFFPGDYVVQGGEEGSDVLAYGVVQKVDHQGRTATVQWFKSESHGDILKSTFVKESDISVYDLKDHPDFKYRPGSVVIRVGGSDTTNNDKEKLASSIAGQVLDISPAGKLHVWWANGETSSVWPQELYRIGEYDSDDGELWDDGDEGSDESWETESEESIVGDGEKEVQRLKLAVTHLRESHSAMQRVQTMLTQNPSFQTMEFMQKLLEVYKNCRFLDRQLGTTYFHEYYFEGLIDRKGGFGTPRISQYVEKATEHLRRCCGLDTSPSTSPNASTVALAEFDRSIHRFLTQVCSITDQLKVISHETTEDVPTETQIESASTFSVAPQDKSQNEEVSGAKLLDEAAGFAQPSCETDTLNIVNLNVCARLSRLMARQLEKVRKEVAKRCDQQLSPLLEEPLAKPQSDVAPTAEPEIEDDEPEEEDVENFTELAKEKGVFTLLETCPSHHKFADSEFKPVDRKIFQKAVRQEMHLLQTSLPTGIDVKCFEDRMDLCSVLIRGPFNTPYEDGLFFFDIQLSPDYPRAPPLCHYHSYCSDRLNPNLYEDGKVCVSLLGTWSGKGTEVWGPGSNLLQVLVSIQGLILVSEPYYNEAGYERQKGSLQAQENSRMYNEMVLLKLMQATTKIIQQPPPLFQDEVRQHFTACAPKIMKNFTYWLGVSEDYSNQRSPEAKADHTGLTGPDLPDFPLLPASRGFCLTLRSALQQFEKACQMVLGLTLEDTPSGNR